MTTCTTEAIKTALSMVLVYGIALAIPLDRPYWGGFAVAVISLSTTGQSVNKGLMRLGGTVIAAAVAFTLIAFFKQDRWWFVSALSVYLGLCGYMVTGKTNQYFWFVSAFVCIVISVASGDSSQSAFLTGMARLEETVLGVAVYSVVSLLLWPRTGRAEFDAAGRALVEAERDLCRAYRASFTHVAERGGSDAEGSSRKVGQQLARFGKARLAAETDTGEVAAAREEWRRFGRWAGDVMETLDRLRTSCRDIVSLDMATLVPGAVELFDELDLRWQTIGEMMAGKADDRTAVPVDLRIDRAAVASLPPLQRAALTLTLSDLRNLGSSSRKMLDGIRSIRAVGRGAAPPRREPASRAATFLDPDRLGAAFSIVVTLWIAFLLWIYVDPPGHAGFVQFSVILALIIQQTPQVRVTSLIPPFGLGGLYAGFVYLVVMPRLSSYVELGLVIFGSIFAINYLFSEPRQTLARMGGMITFVSLVTISNEQTYSFSGYANGLAMLMIAISLAVLTTQIPTSACPEKVFLRLRKRFFRNGRVLVTLWRSTGHGQAPGAAPRLHDLVALPAKLGAWGRFLEPSVLSGRSGDDVQGLVSSLESIAIRVRVLGELLGASENRRLSADDRRAVDDWLDVTGRTLAAWSRDPTSVSVDAIRDEQAEHLATLEDHVARLTPDKESEEFVDEELDALYRVLGGCRSLSHALLEHAEIAQTFAWDRWREARF